MSTAAFSGHRRTVQDEVHEWSAETLWELARGLEVLHVAPQQVLDLDRDGWFVGVTPTARRVLEHMRRILDADLAYPIILDADGTIMDGAHRAAKAILLGHATVSVVRFAETPPPTRIRRTHEAS